MPATAESVAKARRAVGEAAGFAGATSAVVEDAVLATSEAVTNVVRHAYAGGTGTLTLVTRAEKQSFDVLVVDEGAGFDQAATSDPRRVPGHFGLRLVALLTREHSITSSASAGTTVRMSFALPDELPSLE